MAAKVEGEHTPSDPALPLLQHSRTGKIAEWICGHTGITVRWTLMKNYVDHWTLEPVVQLVDHSRLLGVIFDWVSSNL